MDASSLQDLLSGEWQNEWNSILDIKATFSNPNAIGFSGTYFTGVWPGGTLPAPDRFPMSGLCDTALSATTDSVALGWVVVWNNGTDAESATSWSGQLMNFSDNPDFPLWGIVATWLLAVETSVDNIWTSTSIGMDLFTPYQPGTVTDFAEMRRLLEIKRQRIRSNRH